MGYSVSPEEWTHSHFTAGNKYLLRHTTQLQFSVASLLADSQLLLFDRVGWTGVFYLLHDLTQQKRNSVWVNSLLWLREIYVQSMNYVIVLVSYFAKILLQLGVVDGEIY